MLTENEVTTIIADEEIHEVVKKLKKEFKSKEAPNLVLSDHDFLSLVFIIPTVGIAMANGSISFMEEMELNKKARKVSKGGFFMRVDPVVHAMKYLIKKHQDWEDVFYELIRKIMKKFVNMDEIISQKGEGENVSDQEFKVMVMKAPFLYVRMMRAFFLASADADITTGRKLNQQEYDKVVEIGERLEIADTILYRKFLTTLIVK